MAPTRVSRRKALFAVAAVAAALLLLTAAPAHAAGRALLQGLDGSSSAAAAVDALAAAIPTVNATAEALAPAANATAPSGFSSLLSPFGSLFSRQDGVADADAEAEAAPFAAFADEAEVDGVAADEADLLAEEEAVAAEEEAAPVEAADAAAEEAAPVAAPIGGSVTLLGEYDWHVEPGSDGNPWSRCADMVRHALKESGSSAVQFIPTLGFLLPTTTKTTTTTGGNRSNAAQRIASFCMFVSGEVGAPSPCEPLTTSLATAARLAAFKRDMEHCFLEGFRAGARTVVIRPHLDSGAGDGAWRNSLLLEPDVAYGGGGVSYTDIMLAPLADALAGAQTTWAQEAAAMGLAASVLPRVDFALQGEMSATVVRFPEAWQALVEPVRARASARAQSSSPSSPSSSTSTPRVRIGVGMNFNRLDDVSSVSQTHESSRLSWASWALGLTDVGKTGAAAGVPEIDGEALGRLLRSVEFISVSAYAPVSGPGFKQDELGNAAFMLVEQLDAIGVPGAMDGLLKPFGPVELQYGEVGVGGGNSYKGTTRATNPSEVALRPFFGVYGAHDDAHDPWLIPANAAFRREYFQKLASWMAGGVSNKRFHVGAAYLWSKASWDVLEIYDRGYHSDDIAHDLRAYNCGVGTGIWGCDGESGEGGSGGASGPSTDGGLGGIEGAAAVVVTVMSANRAAAVVDEPLVLNLTP